MLCEAPWFDIEQCLHTGVPYIYFPPLVAIENFFILILICSKLIDEYIFFLNIVLLNFVIF